MSLQVFIQAHTTPPSSANSHSDQYKHVLEFDDFYEFDDEEGYYWFMWPFFLELHKQTGQMVDLYGVALFGGDDLNALSATLDQIRALAQVQPDEWNVGFGFTTGANPREIVTPVNKQTMLVLIDKLQIAANEALEEKRYLGFWGD